METIKHQLAVLTKGNVLLSETDTTHRTRFGLRPIGRKAFFADAELSASFNGNYFDYMKSNESIGGIASEEARAAGLILAGVNRSVDKNSGKLVATSIRWAAPPKGKADDEIAKLRLELAAATTELLKLRPAKK